MKTGIALIDEAKELKPRQRAFIYNYCCITSPTRNNGAQSAKSAGYGNANAAVTRLGKSPLIKNIIKQLTDDLNLEKLREANTAFIDLKIKRAQYDVSDFYQEEERKNKDEQVYKVMALKPLKELDDEQRMMIDGIDFKGVHGASVYVLPSRREEMNDIMKIYKEAEKNNTSNTEQGTISTIELIRETKERIIIKQESRSVEQEEYRLLEEEYCVQDDDDLPEEE